jgi:hypothetical protein
MTGNSKKSVAWFQGQHTDLWLMGFVFLLLLVLPAIFTKVDGVISWRNVFKIWQDRALLVPLFILNHWVLVPRLILKKQYTIYVSLIAVMIFGLTLFYYFHDEYRSMSRQERNREPFQYESDNLASRKPPTPVPPYADLLMFSLLIVAVDTGLSLSKNWHRNEEDKIRLEQENTRIQLNSLRNQVSPHFFMNTLNNIYALIDADTERSKTAIMKLSKLMRYLLYENKDGKVKLSKEFEFIRSYTDLMALRFSEGVTIQLDLPVDYTDHEIPPMLFLAYIENAFKYGASYRQQSLIRIAFDIADDKLIFTCVNSIASQGQTSGSGGLGLENNRQRLDLLYHKNYTLNINRMETLFTVELQIPLT